MTFLLRMIRWIIIRNKKLSLILPPNIQISLHSLITCIILNLSFTLNIQIQHRKLIRQNGIISKLLINPTSLTLHTALMFLLPRNLLKQPTFHLNLLQTLIQIFSNLLLLFRLNLLAFIFIFNKGFQPLLWPIAASIWWDIHSTLFRNL